MEKVLFADAQYSGQYVACRSVQDNEVVGAGATPTEALKQANQSGIAEPVLVFVPVKESVYIY